MTALCKVTDQNGCDANGCQWGEGIEHAASGKGKLCGPGWLHACIDPLVGAMLVPIRYRQFTNRLGWEADGDVGATDGGLILGCTRLKTLRQVALPKVTFTQRIAVGILSALVVYDEPFFAYWAHKWLSGEDRSTETAEAVAARMAWAPLQAPAWAAWSASDVEMGSGAAIMAVWAVQTAIWHKPLDLPALARKAMEVPETMNIEAERGVTC